VKSSIPKKTSEEWEKREGRGVMGGGGRTKEKKGSGPLPLLLGKKGNPSPATNEIRGRKAFAGGTVEETEAHHIRIGL